VSAGGPVRNYQDAQILHRHLKACQVAGRTDRSSQPRPEWPDPMNTPLKNRTLWLYNSLTRKKEVFEPSDPNRVTMYVCGPTVYNYAHIGNARPAVVFDLLARLLRRLYPHVVYARNITDIEDKIIAAAKEQGVDISAITEKYIARIWARLACCRLISSRRRRKPSPR
jgi:hypothetical protein